jgi:hypothetical protein
MKYGSLRFMASDAVNVWMEISNRGGIGATEVDSGVMRPPSL